MTEPESEAPTPQARGEALTLLATVFFVAACGLIYELLLATVSSYLLGSSVTQFSLCIGAFIGAMGVGSYLSQFVRRGLLRWFLAVELALAVVGGFSAWGLFAAYAYFGGGYYAALFGTLALIGGLTGIELPLLTRLLSRYGALRTTIAQALSFDYIGALLGSVAFPLLLLPLLGTARTAFLVGLLNLAVAGWNLWVFRRRLAAPAAPMALCCGLAVALGIGFVVAERANRFFEKRLYDDQVLFVRQTPYQRIVVTRFRNDLRLYLDGNLQFSSADEYRYHESLVHPALSLAPRRAEVLVLGGGDGLGVREILKWPDVRRITLVDIDPAMTDLAQRFPALRAQNGDALADRRVRLVHEDAFKFLERDEAFYDVVIGDLPDPNNEALAKLYTDSFYKLVRHRLARGGLFVTQATSPLFSRDAFWCVDMTLRSAGFATTPYHAYVPTFGDWGWILASPGKKAPDLNALRLPPTLPLRFLSSAAPITLTAFDADTNRVPVEPSLLDRPQILTYYERNTRQWETN